MRETTYRCILFPGHMYISDERKGHRSQVATGDERVVGARAHLPDVQQPRRAAAARRHHRRDHWPAGRQPDDPRVTALEPVNHSVVCASPGEGIFLQLSLAGMPYGTVNIYLLCLRTHCVLTLWKL